MKDLYVVNCCRTAIGSFGGSLKNTPATEMGAIVVKEALKLVGFPVGGVRLPLVDATPEQSARLASLMREVGVL